MTSQPRLSVLFVCLGNICRSPTAEGVFRRYVEAAGLADRIFIDSAGTGDYHLGQAPDRRAQSAALRRKYDLSGLRARQVTVEDFERFDYILAMDRENLAALRELAPPEYRDKAALFLKYGKGNPQAEVPDPFFGEAAGFDTVLDLVEDASVGLVEHLRQRLATFR